MKRPSRQICFAVVSVLLLTGADWLQFRGNNGNSIAFDAKPPTEMDHIAWSVEVPGRGLSGPIVIGDRVVVTSSSGFRQNRLHVNCFEAKTGKTLWHRQFWATGSTMCHPKMSIATPTPASDGKRIFAFYSSNDVACLDLEGNLLWYRGLTYDFPNARNSLGMASSPIVVGNTLIVMVENNAESFSTGLDTKTGIARWKMDRPRAANWTTPSVLKGKTTDDDLVLIQSSSGLIAVAPKSGKVKWSYDDGASTIPSAVVVENTIYVPSKGLTALKPTPTGSTPELLWQQSRLGPSMPSPLTYRGRAYVINRAGVLTSASAKTGEVVWKLRLKGPFSGTPAVANGHLYVFGEKGLAQVVRLGDKKGEIVSTHDLKETILCSPAIAGDAIYVRSDGHLWKIAD